MNTENMRKIMKEYQYKRDKNQTLLEKRIEEVYGKYPEIKYISEEIKKTGLKMTKAVIFEDSIENLQYLENRQNELIQKKNELFEKYEIPKGYLEMSYDCKVCNDTGFLENGSKCNCLKQRILNDTYAMSNLEEILQEDNFNTFDIDIFSNQKVEGREKSPREHMKEMLLDMNNYAFNFGNKNSSAPDNLIFIGSPGLGKTFMCSCIAKEILNKGYTVIYQTSFNLMEVIERYKFKTETFSLKDEENYNNLFTCDLLIIDDLGTEMPNSFTTSELFNIINSRINSKKKTIISTNLGLGQIREIYTERVLSRIVGNFKLYEFYGEDLRF